jgi:glutathione S-transferase
MPVILHLVRLVFPPKDEGEMNNEKEDQINKILTQIGTLLNNIEKRLNKTSFIVTDKITIVDICIYCELS